MIDALDFTEKSTILAVDDTSDNLALDRRVAQRYLQSQSRQQRRKALKSFAAEPPDLILLDIIMPGVWTVMTFAVLSTRGLFTRYRHLFEKDLAINDELEKLRLSATSALLSGRKDIIVVSSVSCIYGIGNPEDFHNGIINIEKGQRMSRNHFLRSLTSAQYKRNDRA